MSGRLLFVVEQTLGHRAHTLNLERAISESGVRAELIRLPFEAAPGLRRWPGLRSWSVRASWTARLEISKRLRRGDLAGLFIHTQVASLFAVDLMRRVPTVVSLDATPVNFDAEGEHYGHRRQPAPLELGKRWLNRRALHAASAVVAWSRWTADSLAADYGVDRARIHVIHPGVDLQLFDAANRQRDGAVRILFVGGDFERKGGPELLAATEGMPAVELDLVTAGPVPARPNVRVHRLEPQSPALRDLFARADIFALPSRSDCLPQAVAEAMASGLPVIATDVGAMSEVVRGGSNGYLVPRGSVEALGAAIRTLAGDPAQRRRMGEAARRLAVDRHDAARNNRQVIELLASVAGLSPTLARSA
ncbi:MAG TPA: glycosyltransferase family 4 protein [Candidatus Dormibacteraeota bacterium]